MGTESRGPDNYTVDNGDGTTSTTTDAGKYTVTHDAAGNPTGITDNSTGIHHDTPPPE